MIRPPAPHCCPDLAARTCAFFGLARPDAPDRTLAAFDAVAGEDIARTWFWNHEATVVNRDEYIHTVLVERASDFRKGPLLSVNAKPLLGNGLLTGDNAFNKRQRRFIAPGFAHKKVAGYAAVVARRATGQLDSWGSGAVVDVDKEMLAITLAVMGDLLFSADLIGESENIGRAITTLMHFAIDELRAPWRAAVAVPRALRALVFLNQTLNRRIAARRRDGDEEADLLALLLSAKGDDGTLAMDDKLVRAETMTLFLAGLETVAAALTWSLTLLAMHPDVYARVQAEVDARPAAPSTAADLCALPYTLQVFKESLRLFPPAYIVARQALRAVPVGPYTLGRGTVVFVSPYLLHRRAAYFPDPGRFDPDRWADADAEKNLPSRYAFMPFGAGPRVCVGGHFAFLEAHLILAHVLRGFDLSLVPGQSITPCPLFTLRPARPVRMKVTRR